MANIANANKKDRPDSHLRKAEARAEAVAGNALRREVAKLREETLATYGRGAWSGHAAVGCGAAGARAAVLLHSSVPGVQ